MSAGAVLDASEEALEAYRLLGRVRLAGGDLFDWLNDGLTGEITPAWIEAHHSAGDINAVIEQWATKVVEKGAAHHLLIDHHETIDLVRACAAEARLMHLLDTLSIEQMRTFALDCAERALELTEPAADGDGFWTTVLQRARRCIETLRRGRPLSQEDVYALHSARMARQRLADDCGFDPVQILEPLDAVCAADDACRAVALDDAIEAACRAAAAAPNIAGVYYDIEQAEEAAAARRAERERQVRRLLTIS